MFPPALVLFLLAGAGGVWLAFSRGRRALGGCIAVMNTALALYEYSFTLVPVREWIRVDLLVTLPLALLCLAAVAVVEFKARRRLLP